MERKHTYFPVKIVSGIVLTTQESLQLQLIMYVSAVK